MLAECGNYENCGGIVGISIFVKIGCGKKYMIV